MSLEDELADALELIMRNASDEVLTIIAEALGNVTEDLTYAEIVISSKSVDAKVQAILDKARKSGNAEIERVYGKLEAERAEWAKPYFEANGLAQSESAVRDAIIASGAVKAKKTLDELTSVVGIVQGSKVVSTRTAYTKAVSQAASAVHVGSDAFTSVVQKTCRQLANSGVRVVPKATFESGRTQELYSVVRRDVMADFRETVHDYSEELGKEFGADGWEVSAHALCAQDHLQYQGEQYSKKEMDAIQSLLERQGRPLEYGANCHHQLSPVVLGVSSHRYSPNDIIEMRRYSTEKVTITGLNGQQRTMSRYDASQYLRSLENTSRRYNTQKNLDKIAGVKSNAGIMERHTRSAARKLCDDTGLQYRPDFMRSSVK